MNYTDRNNPPSRDGLEDHQHWVWMWDEPLPGPHFFGSSWTEKDLKHRPGHWEIVGTGAILEP